jgi:hypothetical protein
MAELNPREPSAKTPRCNIIRQTHTLGVKDDTKTAKGADSGTFLWPESSKAEMLRLLASPGWFLSVRCRTKAHILRAGDYCTGQPNVSHFGIIRDLSP